MDIGYLFITIIHIILLLLNKLNVFLLIKILVFLLSLYFFIKNICTDTQSVRHLPTGKRRTYLKEY